MMGMSSFGRVPSVGSSVESDTHSKVKKKENMSLTIGEFRSPSVFMHVIQLPRF